MKVSAVEGR